MSLTKNFNKGSLFNKGTLKLSDLITDLKKNEQIAKCGAIYSFTGITRNSSKMSDKIVKKIVIEAWEDQAGKKLNEIAEKAIKDFNLIDVRLYHGVGEFSLGEEMVFIVVASSHREAGLEAIEKLIEQYKTIAPIWKKEIYSDDSSDWISGKEKAN